MGMMTWGWFGLKLGVAPENRIGDMGNFMQLWPFMNIMYVYLDISMGLYILQMGL